MAQIGLLVDCGRVSYSYGRGLRREAQVISFLSLWERIKVSAKLLRAKPSPLPLSQSERGYAARDRMGAQFGVRRLDAALLGFLFLRNLRNLWICRLARARRVSNVTARLLLPLLFIDSKNQQPEGHCSGTC